MTTFPYNNTVPAAADNPSFDQPIMLVNCQSIKTIIGTDHLTFGNAQGGGPNVTDGQHKQITFANKFVPGFTPTDPLSVAYTNNIAAPGSFNTASASTTAEMFYINNSATFILSCIKAFGCFDSSGNSLNAWNLALQSSGGHPSAGTFIFNMPVNVCTGTNYLILLTSKAPAIVFLASSYSISSATSFTVQFQQGSIGTNPSQFSIIVLQL